MLNKLLPLALSCFLFSHVLASPPDPPLGYRWVLQEEFSDEFDGDKLDSEKWNNYYPGWEGRAPARFEKKAIKVNDGKLTITSGVLKKQKGRYTMYGGAVTSKTKNAHYGYYECKAKASKIAMSTTFWMSNDKVPFIESGDCDNDKYSQELDIQEAVGGSTVHEKFRKGMNSNTHYRYIKCNERKETFISKGAGTLLDSEVSDDYHIYAAWWKNAEEVFFYADNRFFQHVKVSKEISEQPFNRPMQINMVTETYNWQPAPSKEDLENSKINTAYYDWVRSYKLVPVNENYTQPATEAFDELIELHDVPSSIYKRKSLEFSYLYSCNQDCSIHFSIIEDKNKTRQKYIRNAFKGKGFANFAIDLDFEALASKSYRLVAELRNGKNIIQSQSIDVSR